MHQITNLRLLVSSANPLFLTPLRSSSLSLLFKTKTLQTNHKPLSLFTTFSSSSFKKPPRSPSKPFTPARRNTSSLKESEKGKEGSVMEVCESVGFNRKRAEGRDKSDRPKNLQLKVRKLNPINTICYVQILGTGMDTQDTSPSVLLFFDKQRFIFNAGEGLQRFCTEHKIKLSKIDHIFLSRVCSETAGGLPGLLLTLAGMGDEGMSVNVWGPSDFNYLVDAMKSFIPNAAMVHTRSFGRAVSDGAAIHDPRQFDDPLVLIDDEVVKLSAVLLRPSCSKFSLEDSQERLLQQNKDHKAELALKPGDISVMYIVELPEIKGKFDPKKAAALGLRPGPKYRDLQLGNPVMSDRQSIMVHPSDVLGPSIPGPVVLLVDCPTVPHMQELLSTKSLGNYYDASGSPTENCKAVNCVIHLSPSTVTNTSEYQKWMSRFGVAQHIMAGHEMRNVEIPILKASARTAARLNYLCPQFFPAPGFWSLQPLKCLATGTIASSEGPVSMLRETISAENLLKFVAIMKILGVTYCLLCVEQFHLRPYAQLGLDRSGVPPSTAPSEIINELLSEIPEIVDAAQQVAEFWPGGKVTGEGLPSIQDNNNMIVEPWLSDNALPRCLKDVSREDMEIVLLGTGSSQPSKYRNVSSIFINLFSKGSLILDCGEGTLGQLKRRFGIEGADDAVRRLRCIWVSHIHADHHTGLARLLALRRDLLRGLPHEPLLVVGPRQLKRFLDAYERLENLDMQFLDCRHTTKASLDAFESTQDSSSSDSPSNSGSANGEIAALTNQPIDFNLFAKGSRMQSYWKRPGSPVDTSAVSPILRNLKKILGEVGLEALISFPVVHCPQAFGVVLKAADRINSVGEMIPGWKIVYSGDTRPCPELIKASSGATVLIHEANAMSSGCSTKSSFSNDGPYCDFEHIELLSNTILDSPFPTNIWATFEDGMVDEAIARNHSTTKEAVEVGDSAGAYRIILTHFSQRYPKIPVFDETHMHKTCIAFDMMSVNLADLQVLPKVVPYLKLLFKNEIVVDETEDALDVSTVAG
ncbi:hypothetical protein RJ639_040899 [Escallonia herrerae]|uniref:ribonuclease Z n=1 Tax=Escallonia herrerae TaxID=1293975 RepID=A0AA88WH95_9ASTE|nr:hypothetical protein RJ639_040899 [Escallonia herrerae]